MDRVLGLFMCFTLCFGSGTGLIAGDSESASEKQTGTSFTWYRTGKDVKNPMDWYPFAANKVRDHVVDHMADKGYRFAEKKADFYVVFYGSTKDRLATSGDNYREWRTDGWVFSWGDPKPYKTYRKKCRLVIDVVSADTGELVWRGTTRKRIHGGRGHYQMKIEKAVAELFKTFPRQLHPGAK